MGLSGIKLFIIAAVVAILFLPMLLRQARAIPELLERARVAIAGEDDPAETPGDRGTAAPRADNRPPAGSTAERLGRGVGKALQRLGRFRAG
jgi:Sec-independent protein translocase protein TatA